MRFETIGNPQNPAVLFFHAMGVTGASSEPVARNLQERYFCILPTSTVYCAGQTYAGKADEVRQVEEFLRSCGVTRAGAGGGFLHRGRPCHGLSDANPAARGARFLRRRPVCPDRKIDPPNHGSLPVSGHQEPVLVEGENAQEGHVVR